jgi:23S rRNA (adenine-N6)-dimethyltransferase
VADLARSRRAWGWHPLVDEWAARIVADAGVRPGNLVLDIGAGRGALTRHLVNAGARVIAVEPHPGRARWLRERFANAAVTVVQCDVLELRLPRRPFRVVASPPYSIASALLRQLLAPHTALVAADLVLQRAVVRRHVERPPGRWHLQVGTSLPRNAFRPPPQVDSAVLVIRRRPTGPRRTP